MYVAAACDSPAPLILLSLPQIYGFLRTSPRSPPPIFFKIDLNLTNRNFMKQHSHGAKVGGAMRNRTSRAAPPGRLTGNPRRLTGKTGALTEKTGRATEKMDRATEIPRRATKSVSRYEIYISRRDLYISQRDFYISQCEIDFASCGGELSDSRRRPRQAARQP